MGLRHRRPFFGPLCCYPSTQPIHEVRRGRWSRLKQRLKPQTPMPIRSRDGMKSQLVDKVITTTPTLEVTGERIIPGKTAEKLFREHEERYVFAGQYVSGKDVLDVACG